MLIRHELPRLEAELLSPEDREQGDHFIADNVSSDSESDNQQEEPELVHSLDRPLVEEEIINANDG